MTTMSADEVKMARLEIGSAMGKSLTQRDLGLMLGLAPASADRTVRNWETDGPTGPVAVALRLMMHCARNKDIDVLRYLPN
jgi:hypothetical protein